MKHNKSQEEIVNFNNAVNSKLNNKTNIKKYWNFFPTPSQLIEKMLDEYKTKPLPKNILEPSAGKGDIIDYLNKIQNKRNQQSNIYAFEFVPQLQEILKQKRNGRTRKIPFKIKLYAKTNQKTNQIGADFPKKNSQTSKKKWKYTKTKHSQKWSKKSSTPKKES
jgi:phospholipid N-methyltransferase